ncbi:MAG TPA: hypothetical protein VHC69_33145 [Polyangiaceae bacterium]|nr:hypothetical protein [Polyangiaceae bacterium]
MAQTSDRRLSKLEKALDLRAVRPNTRETYLRCAGKFLDAVGKPAGRVTCGDVERFLHDQVQLGARRARVMCTLPRSGGCCAPWGAAM